MEKAGTVYKEKLVKLLVVEKIKIIYDGQTEF